MERIRDYFASQIKALRAQNINAQVIQQQSFLRLKPIYTFLHTRQPQLGAEIAQAYTNTMRWYYSTHFTRYHAALSKLKLHVTDRTALIGENILTAPRTRGAPGQSHDPFNLGRRIDTLQTTSNAALPSQTAEESKAPHNIETPFVAYNLALIDNASFEYQFLTTFFHPSLPTSTTSRHFTTSFAPTLTLGTTLTKHLIADTCDALGLLLLVRTTQHLAFTLQRRKVPALDAYINATSMLLWPRFQSIMDAHCDSLHRLTLSLPSRPSAAALIAGNTTPAGPSTAPHPLTQRFAVFVHGILELSSEAGDDEPVSASLARLRHEYEGFLERLKAAFGAGEKGRREGARAVANNCSLLLTVLGDGRGRLGGEMRAWVEGVMGGVGT